MRRMEYMYRTDPDVQIKDERVEENIIVCEDEDVPTNMNKAKSEGGQRMAAVMLS